MVTQSKGNVVVDIPNSGYKVEINHLNNFISVSHSEVFICQVYFNSNSTDKIAWSGPELNARALMPFEDAVNLVSIIVNYRFFDAKINSYRRHRINEVINTISKYNYEN